MTCYAGDWACLRNRDTFARHLNATTQRPVGDPAGKVTGKRLNHLVNHVVVNKSHG